MGDTAAPRYFRQRAGMPTTLQHPFLQQTGPRRGQRLP
jgi:hypothetical protein